MTERMAEQDDAFCNSDERSARGAKEPIPVLPAEWQRMRERADMDPPERDDGPKARKDAGPVTT